MDYFFEILDYKNTPWLIILLTGTIGLIVSAMVINLIKITASKKQWRVVRAIRENLSSVLYFFVPLVFITAVLKTYSLSDPHYEWLFAISKTLLIGVTTWLIARIVIIVEKILIDQLDFNTRRITIRRGGCLPRSSL
jgi:hypothetical protein